MTPRLKILSIGLALSLIYSVYDYVDRNKNKKPVVTKTKKKKKRARTAGVSLTRGIDLKKKIEARKQREEKKNFTPQEGFLPISDDVAALEGWSRNPFVEVYEPPSITKANRNQDIKQDIKLDEKPVFTSLDGLIIETAVRMGDKAFVTINGQTFTEGDLINDALIEKIENEHITFKIGKTRIIKDVGT